MLKNTKLNEDQSWVNYHDQDEEPDSSALEEELEQRWKQDLETASRPDMRDLSFPAESSYAAIDRWALAHLKKMRADLDFKLRDNAATFSEGIDWYADDGDWKKSARKYLEETGWGGAAGPYLLHHGSDIDREQALEWVKQWLARGGFDFDCYYSETFSFFRKELPELEDFFETDDFTDWDERVAEYKYGATNLEKMLHDGVLSFIEDSEFDQYGILLHSALSRQDIEQMFTPDELIAIHMGLKIWAGTADEEQLRLKHNKSVRLALKMDWIDVLDVLVESNPLLSHLFWSVFEDCRKVSKYTQTRFQDFCEHLQNDIDCPQERLNECIESIGMAWDSTAKYFFGDEGVLLWSLSPKHNAVIRPLFAHRIEQIIKNNPRQPAINNLTYLAISWSRMREMEMKALLSKS